MSEIEKDNDIATVRPIGDITAATVYGLRDELRRLFEEGIREIVLDLVHVSSIDSLGIGLVVATHNSLSKEDGKIGLINANAEICKLLNMLRLDQHFSITCSNREA